MSVIIYWAFAIVRCDGDRALLCECLRESYRLIIILSASAIQEEMARHCHCVDTSISPSTGSNRHKVFLIRNKFAHCLLWLDMVIGVSHTQIYTHTYTHIHIHTYIYTHTYTHIRTQHMYIHTHNTHTSTYLNCILNGWNIELFANMTLRLPTPVFCTIPLKMD